MPGIVHGAVATLWWVAERGWKARSFYGLRRFSKWLRSVIVDHEASEGVHGLIAFEIGTHSFRKGVAIVADWPAGPSPISIFLRAGWSLGAFTSRYLFAGPHAARQSN